MTEVVVSERELEIRRKLKNDFPHYAKKCLVIRTKVDGPQPFVLNKAQIYLHKKIEAQLKRTGKVRANLLKGRQQGASTYVGGRYYWRVTHRKGVRAFILTHEEEGTKNLFDMTQRYHDNNNPVVKPSTGASNARELIFDQLDSGYRVGTAGNKGVGRSSTIQYFHGSEVAFWPHAEEHAKGVMQAIPDSPGTEVILESTANGVGNYFHAQWKKAERGEGEYINIFIPWYWTDEYRKKVPDDFFLNDEEIFLKDTYKLDDEQLYWRRVKIAELGVNGEDGEASFKQEYPFNAAEAFQMTGQLGLIMPKSVMKARSTTVQGIGPLIVGVDPSRGVDRFSLIKRQGRKAYDLQSYKGEQVETLGQQVAICKKVLDATCSIAGKKVDMMFIDAGGGDALVDRLHELGYQSRVKAIKFGANPLNKDKYINRRGEMWGELAQWLTDENLDVDVPDMDTLQADLCASLYRRDSMDRIVLLKKDEIKLRLGYSPDEGDSLALTFAEPVTTGQKIDPNAFFGRRYG